ncbi:MAG TPA: TIGR00153 family protein [Acidobacteriota bacterium]|nr:TIGR00153 family protein [Acidobacteriota bacterium]
MRTYGGLFGKSPFGPLHAHAVKVNECVRLLRPLFESLLAGDDEKVDSLIDEICDLESEADAIKNDLRDKLPRTLFLPAARSDLLVVLEVQDGIADASEDASALLRIRRITVPEAFRADLIKLVEHAQAACDSLLELFNRLHDLLEGSFRGKAATDVFEGIIDVSRAEQRADMVLHTLLSKLYNSEDQLTTPEFIIWDKLIANLSRVADLSEKAANRMRLIIAR